MEFKRRTKKIKIARDMVTIQNIVPYDFFDVEMWPFNRYLIVDGKKQEKEAYKDYVKSIRDWKKQPKTVEKSQKQIEENMRNAIVRGIVDDGKLKISENYNLFKEKMPEMHAKLLDAIYVLTYELTNFDILIGGQKAINKEHAEIIYLTSQKYGVEPYALIADLNKSVPEYYNPDRYDFNSTILSVGIARENKNNEEAIKKLKKVK